MTLLYVSASKGFRPGGPNVSVGIICDSNLTALGISQVPGQFASDSLWSYEIGSKNTFFDHTLQINASLFYIDWNNIQQNVYLPRLRRAVHRQSRQSQERGRRHRGGLQSRWPRSPST